PRVAPFKDTEVGRAVLTVLRLATRDDDYVALRTLLKLRHGVGVATAAAIADTSIQNNLNYHDLFHEPLPEDILSGRGVAALLDARDVVAELEGWSADNAIGDRA